MRRLRTPLPAALPDTALIHLNNAFNLWHGPVAVAPLAPAV